MSKNILPLRSDIPVQETWNLESIFPTVGEWQNAYEEAKSLLPEMQKFQNRLSESPQTLFDCFKAVEKLLTLAMKVYVYAGLALSVDLENQDSASRAGQGASLMAKARAATSFIQPELMSIGFDRLEQWTEENPELGIYKHHFNDLERQAPHIRSAEVEEVMALSTEPLPSAQPPSMYSALVNAELPFEPAVGSDGEEMEVGQSSISALITHSDREIRRTAWENYADAYLAFKNTLAGIQTQAFQRDVFNSQVRNYDSSLEASMMPNNIPADVFHNLIDVFKKNLPTWHRYWRVRRAALDYDKFHVYDIKAPIIAEKIIVPFEQAVEWISEGMAPLGEDYVSTLRDGCTSNRWVDRARNKGKRQGAFSWGSYATQPFIMMSYADDVFSLSTLAHELGHSMHSYYTRKTQPYIYGNYSLFVAEVASNFNQALVRDYLLRTQDDAQFQLALLEEAMSNFHRYFFIMPTLARWELEMHQRVEQGAPVNAQIMINLAADLFAEGYGDEVEFDHDRVGITWAQFGHTYMNYYVYKYATGISGAHTLADGILQGNHGAVDKYLDFLKAGSSMYPLDVLKIAGVDLTTPEPIEKAFGVLADYVDRFEALVS
ncbi:MAG: oligoendopeptidase F [Chloroflexota bacterium]|nr:oligoendopeptidase F [Chloroflexota bacterium]